MFSAYEAVKKLASERPEWLPALGVCHDMAGKTKQFAGKWVLQQVDRKLRSLRPLAQRHILETVYTSRGGNRAYYRMPDREGVGRALQEEGVTVSQ